MSLDGRLSEGLLRSFPERPEDADRALPLVLQRGRRRKRARLAAMTALTVVGLVGTVMLTPRALELFGETRRDGRALFQESSEPPAGAAIVGTWTTSIPDLSGVIRENDLAGVWTLILDDEGGIALDGPALSPGSARASYELLPGQVFRTSLFVGTLCPEFFDHPGAYRWEIATAGGELRFTPLEGRETCPVREAILSSGVWSSAL